MTHALSRYYRLFLLGYVVVCLCGSTVNIMGQTSEPSRYDTTKADAQKLASEAYELAKELPAIGIEQGRSRIQESILAADDLADDSVWGYQCSLAVRQAIAHALVYEMYRSEAGRLNIQQQDQPQSVPFDKQMFMKLWKSNMPKGNQLLDQVRKGSDVIVGFHSSQGFTNSDVLEGKQFDKMPKTVRVRFGKLRRKARNYSLQGKMETPDELFVQTLITIQTLRDLDGFVHVYHKTGLPKDRERLKSAVAEVLEKKHGRRIDDGMKISPLKALSTFSKYCSENYHTYLLQQAMLLGPYMSDTKRLPEQVQPYLTDWKKPEKNSSQKKQEKETADEF